MEIRSADTNFESGTFTAVDEITGREGGEKSAKGRDLTLKHNSRQRNAPVPMFASSYFGEEKCTSPIVA